jgi:hypothetical protein
MSENTYRWQYRRACIESHVDRLYGVRFVNRTHGGQAEHYGWPKRSVGIEWSWGRNTWFCGWELRRISRSCKKCGCKLWVPEAIRKSDCGVH